MNNKFSHNHKDGDSIDGKDCAKIIRHNLKRFFPGVKFSVRTDNSIRISWTDGPLQKEVETLVKGFEGRGFDGMTDCQYIKDSWLMPDGTALFASSGSTGSQPAENTERPHPDAVKVHFYSGFVFCNRDLSPKHYIRCFNTYFEDHEKPEGVDISPDGQYIGVNQIRVEPHWLSNELVRHANSIHGSDYTPREVQLAK